MAGTDTFVGDVDLLDFGGEKELKALTSTVVNSAVADTDSLEFDVKLTDSVFPGRADGDSGIRYWLDQSRPGCRASATGAG